MSISISANKPRLSYATAHGYKNKVSTSKMTNNKAKYNNEHETEYSHHEKAQSRSHTSSLSLHLVLFGRSILPNVRATTGSNIPNSKKIKTII